MLINQCFRIFDDISNFWIKQITIGEQNYEKLQNLFDYGNFNIKNTNILIKKMKNI